MKRRRLLSAATLAIVLQPYSPSALADRGDAHVHRFSDGRNAAQVEVTFEGFDPARVDDETLERWKRDVAGWTEEAWRRLVAVGFRAPSTERTGANRALLRVGIEKASGYSGSAGARSPLRVDSTGLTTGAERLATRTTLVHEIFHMAQFAYGDASIAGDSIVDRYVNTLSEGTATLSQELLLRAYRDDAAGKVNCGTNQLAHPGGDLFFRPAGAEVDVVCTTMLWWKYLAQAFTSLDGHEAGLDTLQRLFRFLEPSTGWRPRGVDRYHATADFTGDGRDELPATSDTHLGLLSPVFPVPGTVDAVNRDARIGGGWLVRPTDRIVGSCDATGDDRAELLVRSDTHLGVVGVDDATGRMTTVIARAHGGRFGGGWVLQADDEILGTADLDGDGRCELLVRSATHVGAIGFTASGVARTLASRAIGARFGGAWRVDRSDRLLASGDMDGDGADELVFVSASHLGVIGYDARRGDLVTRGSAAHGARAAAFELHPAGSALGIGRLGGPDAAGSLVLRGGIELATADLDGRGGLRLRYLDRASYHAHGALADIDGDGADELVFVGGHEGVVGADATRSSGLDVVAALRPGEPLLDGFNGEEYRERPALSERVEWVATGDFDGNGRDELLLRDGRRLVALEATPDETAATGSAWRARMHRTLERQRFDALTAKLDRFIRLESGGRRSLRSMLADHAVANVASRYWGPGTDERYRYLDEIDHPGSIDHDQDPDTHSVSFAAALAPYGRTEWSASQSRWSESYVRVDLDSGPITLRAERRRPSRAGAWSVVVFEADRMVAVHRREGGDLDLRLDYPAGHTAVLAVSAHEVPMDYTVRLSDGSRP